MHNFRSHHFVLDRLESSLSTHKTGILVVGMHRSGTSATAKLLNLLGAALPGNLMPPHSEINAKGFWESYDIASLNDALLGSHQSRWDDILSIPLDDIDQTGSRDFESKAAELLDRDFPDSSLFVLKDPRISRLLPYWLRLFEHMAIEPRVVIAVRHPLEVAASLKRRDKFQEEKSIYLWLRHLMDAERASRNVPRAFVLYDDLLKDWRSTADRLSRELGIVWPTPPDTVKHEASAFLDDQLRHHRHNSYLLNNDDLVANLAKKLYQALQSGEGDIPALVDSIYATLAPTEKILAPILQDISTRVDRSEHQLLENNFATVQAQLVERDAELAEARQAFSGLSAEFEAKCLHVKQLNDDLADTRQAFDNLSAEFDDKCTHVNLLIAETRQLNESLEAQIAKITTLTQVNNSLLQGATSKLAEADLGIRSLLATPGIIKDRSSFFRRKSKSMQLLENTPLFNAIFYVSSHMEVLTSGMTPHEHYLNIGANKGWDPHPLFSTSWYLEHNRDVAQSAMNPLIHYLKSGAKEGRSPHPLFDTALYLKAYPQVASSGMNALEHYLITGGQAGFRPHWLFDGNAYMDAYPEVGEMGMNPLLHYLQFGYLKNYRPHWAFDPLYYLVSNPWIASLGIPPLVHFITKGAKQRLNPNPDFDIADFIMQYPFLEHSNDNPLAYHVRGCDYQAVFNPPARGLTESHTEPLPPPSSPIHNEQTGWPLPAFMDFLYDEFGETIRTEIVTRMQRFHLPFTSEKITPSPTEQEVADWITEITSLSEAMDDTAQPDVSIVIPVYNQLPFTLACIHSVLSSSTRYSFEIIVADDCSTDRTTEIFSQGVGRIRHIPTGQNQGFIRNCNNAARHTRGRYLVLLNNDTIVLPGWLDELIGPLETYPDIGLTGSKLLYPDGRLQESGGIIFDDGSGWNYGRADDPRKPQYCYMRDADYVSGASIALRTEFWQTAGGFDEQYSVAYYEDTDMAFRVRQAGLRVVVQPLSQLLHFEGISSGTDTSSGAKKYQVTNASLFHKKWAPVLSGYGQCNPEQLPADRTSPGRVLVIDACTPTPDRDAGSVAAFNYLRILKSFGLHISFVPENLISFGSYTQDLQRIGVETLNAPYWMSIEQILKERGSSYDLVLIYRAPIAARLLQLVRFHAPQAKVIFNTVDLHFLREEREAELSGDPQKVKAAANSRKAELNVINQADTTIILSSHEMALLRDLAPKARLHEIPLVCDIPGAGTVGFAQRRDIVFIGGFRHTPNADAIKWFVGEIWPRLREKGFEGRFIIVGSDMPPEITSLHRSDIEVRGYVPDIKDVFNTCRISVAPLRYGAGQKGKVLSSLSFGVPVVATSIAVEGSGFTHGQHVLVANEPEEFADSIIRLYSDQGMWENLSCGGLDHCNRNFSVSVIATRLRSLINDIAPNLNIQNNTHAK